MSIPDPSELASKLHDRLAESQAKTSGDKKFLKWRDLDHPGFKGRYDAYKQAFVEAMKDFLTDQIVITDTLQEIVPVGPTRTLNVKHCYCCSSPFIPRTPNHLACDSCIGDP